MKRNLMVVIALLAGMFWVLVGSIPDPLPQTAADQNGVFAVGHISLPASPQAIAKLPDGIDGQYEHQQRVPPSPVKFLDKEAIALRLPPLQLNLHASLTGSQSLILHLVHQQKFLLMFPFHHFW